MPARNSAKPGGTGRPGGAGGSFGKARHYAWGIDATGSPDDSVAAHLEGIINLALSAQAQAYKDPEGLDALLQEADPQFVGFAIEGASMGLVLRQAKQGDDDSLAAFKTGPWGRFTALIYAGIGLGLGDSGQPVLPYVEAQDDLMAAFVVDGYAFHFGFIDAAGHLHGQPRAADLAGDVGRIFDVGLARSLWFSRAGVIDLVVDGVGAFDGDRRADLWAGIGFAATYAGGLTPDGVSSLVEGAGGHRSMLAAGASLAAHVRVQCDNLVSTTDNNCRMLTGRDALEADELCAKAKSAAGGDTSLAGFIAWREAIAGD
jgi:hypothetical protein